MFDKIPFMPPQASAQAASVDYVFFFIVAVTIVFSLLIAALIVVFGFKFRRKPGAAQPKRVEGNLLLELIWTGIPLGIVGIMFFWGAIVFMNNTLPPPDTMDVFVVGKQWMWKVQHPEGKREINTLHVPINRPVKITLTSEDVIHDFFIPAFRVKMDAVPGKYTTMWFEATKLGIYHLFCAEYCGTDHAKMIGYVNVLSEQDYEQWLTSGPQADGSAAPAPLSVAQQGKLLFNQKGCTTCHNGEALALGPDLNGMYGSKVQFTNGSSSERDENYIRESILYPAKRIVAGYQNVMPSYVGQLNEEEVLALVQYIKELKE